ncbi:MAG TPA: hypothetical protein VG965_03650 [Patescibacteria group bacterium]|nr:hypothetical protein [Patescibacteria group bacterium]
MSARTERMVDFYDASRQTIVLSEQIHDISYGIWAEAARGVRFQPWTIDGVDEMERDGALIQIDPGHRTPLQYIESDTTMYEVPLKGKLLLLSVSPEGRFSIDDFNSEISSSSYMYELKKGSYLCWYASPDQTEPAEVLEYEEPGFKASKLLTVGPGINRGFGGHPIPGDLRTALEVLDEQTRLAQTR